MKTMVRAVLGISIFAVAALANDLPYQTRFITSATLTINVKDGQYLTIRNFTQDTAAPGQRGFIVAGVIPSTPTPTPSPTPTPTPFQTLSTNAGPGIALGGTLNDIATLSGDNNPTGSITFTLRDPSSSVVDIENVTVNGNNSYSTPNGFSPSVTGTYTWSALYSGDGTNPSAADNGQNETVIVTATPTPTPTATPTPTPIFGTILTATLLHPVAILPSFSRPSGESIKPIIIAGPATLTIDPVPGATLSITYRKSLQPIQPSPTATVTTTSTSISTTTSTSTSSTSSESSVGIATTLSQPATVTESMSSTEDDGDSSTPIPTPTAAPTPSPTPTAIPTPTPSPTP